VPLFYYADRGIWYGTDGKGGFSKFTDSQAKSFVAAFGFNKRICKGSVRAVFVTRAQWERSYVIQGSPATEAEAEEMPEQIQLW